MKKKLVSLLLCTVMAVSALAGCGKADPEEEAKSKAAAQGETNASSEGTKEQMEFLLMQSVVIQEILESTDSR